MMDRLALAASETGYHVALGSVSHRSISASTRVEATFCFVDLAGLDNRPRESVFVEATK